MRDNHDGMPEFVNAYERDGLYFSGIQIVLEGVPRMFELGISRKSYLALLRILETRPFDHMPGTKYRYFFRPAYSKRPDPDRCLAWIRIEQGTNFKDSKFEMPQQLIANLLWFQRVKSVDEVSHLQEVSAK
jgi:hypothetical protein